mmetsp:Transcript_13141/g.39150  ORF Transcript_13141/g.39150 Transcript_13141/m.39150 type:complete len:240 (+) Transcript_13141:273-992(+)
MRDPTQPGDIHIADARAVCGLLASVAPRAAGDRKESLTQCYDRVVAAALAVGDGIRPWNADVAFYRRPADAPGAFREVYAARFDSATDSTLVAGRADPGSPMVAMCTGVSVAEFMLEDVGTARAAATVTGRSFACGEFLVSVGTFAVRGEPRAVVVACRFMPALSREAESNFLEACLGLAAAELSVHEPPEFVVEDPDDGWADDEPGPGARGRYCGPLDPQLRSGLCLVRCFRSVCFGS